MFGIGKVTLMAAFLALPTSVAFADEGTIFEGGLPSVLEGGLTSADVHVASVSLTASPAATPAVSVLINKMTGDVILSSPNPTPVLSYDLESNNNAGNGDFLFNNWKQITQPDASGHTFSSTLSDNSFDLNQSGTPGVPYTLNGNYDLGNIVPAHPELADAAALTFYQNDFLDPTHGNINGDSTYGDPSGSSISLGVALQPVPEPATLAGLSLVVGGLFARRRRSR